MSDNEFYIGYKSKAARQLARFLRVTIVSLALGAVALAVVLAALQSPFDPGEFEFGVIREYQGLVLQGPVPTLLVASPDDSDPGSGDLSRFLLVAPGKFGAATLVSRFQGKNVRLQGSLIHREGEAMIELVPDSIRELPVASDHQTPTLLDLGAHTMVGEIVDAKCYLGVMKPGRQKTHRGCAVRCISGGVPPILRVTSTEGEIAHLLLVGPKGESINREILDFVAEPVEISGTIQRLGEQLLFFVDPAAVRRLAPGRLADRSSL